MRAHAVALAFLAAACGNSGGDGPDPTVLVGTWNAACYPARRADGAVTGYVRETLTFTEKTLAAAVSEFAAGDAHCAAPLQSSRTEATYDVGEKSQTVAGAYAIDYTPTAYEATPETEQAASAFRAAIHCGFSDWTVGTTRACPTEGLGTTYDLFKLDGDTLRFGEMAADGGETGSTSEERPTSIGADRVFTKKR